MMNRGAWAIACMLAVGIGLASLAVWFHYQRGRQVLDAFGSPQANLIRHAPQVDAWRMEPADRAEPTQSQPPTPDPSVPPVDHTASGATSESQRRTIDGREWLVTAQCSIEVARGLVHARHALIVDSSYDHWADSTPLPEANWSHALRFQDGQAEVLVLFDFEQRLVGIADQNSVRCRARLIPKLSDAERTFLERELVRAESPARAPDSTPRREDSPKHAQNQS